ncbi:hypothetical protein HMPREF0731_0601, partial [Pseudoroseomonas cervicalis ATCC 49957]
AKGAWPKPGGKGDGAKAREGGGVLAARSQAAPSAAQLDQASASSRSAAHAVISLCHSVIQSSASVSSPSAPGGVPGPASCGGSFSAPAMPCPVCVPVAAPRRGKAGT